MKHLKLRKIWKIFILLIIVGGIYFGTSFSKKEEEVITPVDTSSRVTIEEKKELEISEDVGVTMETPEEEIVEEDIINIGYLNIYDFDRIRDVTLSGNRHYGARFSLGEVVNVTVSSDYNVTTFVIRHGTSIKGTYEVGEFIAYADNNVISFNYEEYTIGYYDLVFVENNQVVGYETIEIIS